MASIRMTGLSSGLDTESMVKQLSEAYQTKVDDAKKVQTKAEWKKEAWASLNTKLLDFYKGSLSTFKSVASYRSKAISGDLKGVKITANNGAVNGSHRVQVLSTAAAQMWTGKKINTGTYTATSYTAAKDATATLGELRDTSGNPLGDKLVNMKFSVTANGKDYNVDLSNKGFGTDTSIDTIVSEINGQLNGSNVSVAYAAGGLQITNASSTTVTSTEADGSTTSKAEGGYEIQITASDDNTASLLGLKTGEAVTVKPASAAANETEHVNVISGGTKLCTEVKTADSKITGSSKISDMNSDLVGKEISINGQKITIGNNTTLSDVASQMAKLGIDANYDAGQGRFYLNAKNTGVDNGFTIGGDQELIAALGLDLQEGDEGRIDASNAKISYNGVEYEQATNAFSINGLSIEAVEKGESQTFSVGTDAQGIYDKVKQFVKDYNTLIAEMNTLYSADRAKDYEPLTDDEKSVMSDDEVEKWEKKIKDSLLRRDDTISSLLTTMRSTLNGQVMVTASDGSTKGYSLASFGIETGTYTEKGLLHIYGDKDDSSYAEQDDKLMAAIKENPDAVEQTLSGLGTQLYDAFRKSMTRIEGVRSSMTFYNDKTMDDEISDYKDKVTKEQEKMTSAEDKFYDQFSAMETAMAKLQAQQTYISQLFGSSS